PLYLLGGGGPPPGAMTELMRDVSEMLPLSRAVAAVQKPWLDMGSPAGDLLAVGAWTALGAGVLALLLHRRTRRRACGLDARRAAARASGQLRARPGFGGGVPVRRAGGTEGDQHVARGGGDEVLVGGHDEPVVADDAQHLGPRVAGLVGGPVELVG